MPSSRIVQAHNSIQLFVQRCLMGLEPKAIADAENDPISDEFYFIVTDKCTECQGFHDEPQCASVCPVDCCIPDTNHVESEDTLLAKKAWLHGE